MKTETLSCHPISVNGKPKYFGLNGNRGRIADIPLSVPNYTAEEQESHARRIVRACNSHEELLRTLEDVLDCNHRLGAISHPIAIEARAALKKAKGPP
jgi:hypothetical protein